MKNTKSSGFTLVELLVTIVITAILATIIILILDPVELIKQSRDSIRLSDLNNLEKGINFTLQESTNRPAEVLCYNHIPPCAGLSTDLGPSARRPDGTGWVKVNLDQGLTSAILPIDPLNDATYYYSYQTNQIGTKWEIDAKLESKKYSPQVTTDQGNNAQQYEIGSDHTIIP